MSTKQDNCKDGVCEVPSQNPNNINKSEDSKKNPQNFTEIKNLILKDHNNTNHTFQQIYSQKPTIFLFIRHFLCFVCRDQVKEIAEMDKSNLDKQNVQLRIIGCGNVEGLNNFAKDTGFPKEQILIDSEDNKAYKALNLTVAKGFNEIKDDNGKEIKTGLFKGFFWYFKNRLFRGNQGNVYQMGGTFLVDQKGEILYQHRDKYSNDYCDMNKFINQDLQQLLQKKQ